MQIELTEKMQSALEKAAASAHMSVSEYAHLIIREQLLRDREAAVERGQTIDRLIEHMKSAASVSGRNGHGWREFIHEGHAE
jgi:hypothetical protein